jgi:hypothetical protein
MKMRIRVPYGVATSVRLGSLLDPTTAQAMTPTFASGDAKITQDDGSGTDNADNLPTVDGTDVLWTISAAEATAPSANGPNRVLQLYDQGTKAWIDLDVIIETEGNSHLASFPNGVIYGFTPTAIGAGTFTGVAAMQTGVNPLRTVAVIVGSDEPLDLGAAMIVDGWTAASQVALGSGGWTRTPTGTLSSLRVALYPDVNRVAPVSEALNTYDAPTHAELTSELATADDATLAAIATLQTDVTAIKGYVDTEMAAALAALTGNLAEATGVPAANASMVTKLNFLFALARNKKVQTASQMVLYADDGTTVLATIPVSTVAGVSVTASEAA